MICWKCQKDKQDFPPGRQYCLECFRKQQAAVTSGRYKDPTYRERQRANRILAKYRITVAAYDEMLKAQNGVCAICSGHNIKRGKALDLCVDHCHKTGKVRGLLCHACNVLLGYAKDNLSTLDRAKLYLEATQ